LKQRFHKTLPPSLTENKSPREAAVEGLGMAAPHHF